MGNTEPVTSYGESQATLCIDSVKELVECVNVDDELQKYDVIVGRTFVDMENIPFIKTNDQLHFAYGKKFPFEDSNVPYGEEKRHTAITTKNLEEIPPNSVKITNVTAQGNDMEILMVNNGDVSVTLSKGKFVGNVKMKNDSVQYSHNSIGIITADTVNYNTEFSEGQVNELLSLINKYRMCFAFRTQELGCTDVDNEVLFACKPYRTSATERKTIAGIVKEWKEAGIVSDTVSPYASPVLLVQKKDGDPRLVVDYRKLNVQTVRKVFPTPQLDDHLETLYGAKMFCTLDLPSGYLQVPFTEEAKEKTAFITPDDTGKFVRMVFGLINAPYEFSKLMQRVLNPLKGKVAMWYLDDVLVPAVSYEMLDRLKLVFEAFQTAHLTLKLRKRYFGFYEVSYLGFLLSSDGVRPGQQKVLSIKNFPTPSNRHEVRRFLGLSGFFRRFIPRYAQLAGPITELLKDSVAFKWAEEQDNAFSNLREKLSSDRVLQLYNPSAYTELHCDASSVGLSGMLLQRGADDRLHLVHAVSKKTTEAEKLYHSSKQELMAIVWSATRMRHYLIGLHFVIVTDCQALIHLNTQKTINPQVARWATLLTEYDYEIKHKSGCKMSHIDALSRAPVGVAGDTEMEVINDKMEVFTLITEEEQVMAMQRTDTRLKTIVDILHREESGRSVNESALVKEYILKFGLLYKEVEVNKVRRKLWVVPNSMRKSRVVRFHDLSGHFSMDRTVGKIMESYYFPRMRRDVRLHIRCCPECVLTKVPRGRQTGALHPIVPGKRPFEIVNIDHLEPFVKSTKGNQYVLVMIDNLTKYVKLYAVRSCGTEGVIASLEKFILQFGTPRRIISDRGTAYTSRAFGEYCARHGVKHTLNSVRHPQANGQVERVNGTLVPVLQASMETDRKWDKHIAEVECNLNNAYNKTMGDTPFHVLYGYFPSFNGGTLRHVVKDEKWDDTTRIQEKIRERIAKGHEMWKLRYDIKHSKPIVYKEGDIVYIKRPPETTGESTKLQPKYRGPLIVTQVLPNDVYSVSALGAEEGRQYSSCVSNEILSFTRFRI